MSISQTITRYLTAADSVFVNQVLLERDQIITSQNFEVVILTINILLKWINHILNDKVNKQKLDNSCNYSPNDVIHGKKVAVNKQIPSNLQI